MRITKSAATKSINQSKSFELFEFSSDELRPDQTKRIRDLTRLIERSVRRNKELKILIIE